MLPARDGIQTIYADAVDAQSLKWTLDEMKRRGLPAELYDQYLNEAIDIGLIPVAGRSVVGGKILTEADILKREDVLIKMDHSFKTNRYFYGIG